MQSSGDASYITLATSNVHAYRVVILVGMLVGLVPAFCLSLFNDDRALGAESEALLSSHAGVPLRSHREDTLHHPGKPRRWRMPRQWGGHACSPDLAPPVLPSRGRLAWHARAKGFRLSTICDVS